MAELILSEQCSPILFGKPPLLPSPVSKRFAQRCQPHTPHGPAGGAGMTHQVILICGVSLSTLCKIKTDGNGRTPATVELPLAIALTLCVAPSNELPCGPKSLVTHRYCSSSFTKNFCVFYHFSISFCFFKNFISASSSSS